jgi:DNA-binding NtrC family response regulator
VGNLHARRVLIADSDSTVRQQLYAALLAVDVLSDVVSSVPDAIDKLDAGDYGVVLVDIALPGGDLEQVLARIARFPERPVVLVAALHPAAARALDVEIVQIVMRKPLGLRQTVEVIRSCVENALTHRAPAETDNDGNGDQLAS